MTTEYALAWAVLPDADLSWRAYRLAVARGFAAWLRTTDPAAQIPPAGLIPSRKPRAPRNLLYRRRGHRAHRGGGVAAVTAADGDLPDPDRAAGRDRRVGEAISLDRGGADLDGGVLVVRHGKQGKSRLVPVHDTATSSSRRLVGIIPRSA